jgi:hypothetical protein
VLMEEVGLLKSQRGGISIGEGSSGPVHTTSVAPAASAPPLAPPLAPAITAADTSGALKLSDLVSSSSCEIMSEELKVRLREWESSMLASKLSLSRYSKLRMPPFVASTNPHNDQEVLEEAASAADMVSPIAKETSFNLDTDSELNDESGVERDPLHLSDMPPTTSTSMPYTYPNGDHSTSISDEAAPKDQREALDMVSQEREADEGPAAIMVCYHRPMCLSTWECIHKKHEADISVSDISDTRTPKGRRDRFHHQHSLCIIDCFRSILPSSIVYQLASSTPQNDL